MIDSDPYDYGTPLAVGGAGTGDGGSVSMESSREERPLGLMDPPVAHAVEIPPEPPDVGARALS